MNKFILAISTSRCQQREIERESTLLVSLIIISLILLPMNFAAPAKMFLYAGILILELLLAMVLYAKDRGTGFDLPLLALCLALFAYLIFCWLMNGGDAVERLIQTALYLSTVITLSRFNWTDDCLKMLRHVLVGLMTICLLYWAAFSRVTNYYSAFYAHGNGFANIVLASFVYLVLTLPIVNRGKKLRFVTLAPLLLSVVLMLLSNSRSAILSLCTFLLALGLLRLIGKKRQIRRSALALFGLVFFCALLFVVVYPSLLGTELGLKLELLSREYLNKNFFSGRQQVWQMILQAVEGNELFGLGLGMVPANIYDTTFSSHNLYLQTILQSGVVGLLLVVSVLLLLLKRVSRRVSWPNCVGAAFIICLLVHECFEVALTQNNFTYGLMYWAIIAISISLSQRTDLDPCEGRPDLV